MTCGIVLLSAAFVVCTAAAAAERPNFLILFGDDWGYGDLGANWDSGSEPPAARHTKNLDKLAASGIRFTGEAGGVFFHWLGCPCTDTALHTAWLYAEPPTPTQPTTPARPRALADFHAAASVCTPSRSGLLTGRYGLRTGITHNFSPPSIAGLPTTEITIGAHLQAAVSWKQK